jgi:hypothetical protein
MKQSDVASARCSAGATPNRTCAVPIGRVLGLVLSFAVFLADVGNAGVAKEKVERFSDRLGERFTVKLGALHRGSSESACVRFAPNLRLAKHFISTAVVGEGEAVEREYPWYPCWVEFSVAGKDVFTCELTPAGRGACKAANGEVTYLVCASRCRELFPDGGSLHEQER